MKEKCKRVICLLTLLMLIAAAAVSAFGENDAVVPTVVRVGYINHPGFMEDNADGTVAGYAAEYLSEICRYTDWELQYVRVPWNVQLDMLRRGELDIVIGQYSEERIADFGINHLPVCILPSLLYIRADDNENLYNIPSTFDDKRIGVLRGSRNIELLKNYSEVIGFTYEPVEFDSANELIDALLDGSIDLLAAEQISSHPELRAVERFSLLPYYIYTSKNNETLLNELNFVLDKINGVNPEYQPRLYQKYYPSAIQHERPYFTREEEEFIKRCGEITVAHIPDSRPGAYSDKDGRIVGIIPDIIDKVSEMSGIKFKHVFVPQDKMPIEFLRENPKYIAGGVLASNPAFKSPEVLVTASYYASTSAIAVRTEMAEAVDINTGNYTIGTTRACQAIQLFVKDKYPNLTVKADYLTVGEGLQALADGEIDLFAYELNMMMPHLGNPRLGDLSIIEYRFMTGPQCTVALASEDNKSLIGIIDKCISVMPNETIDQIEKEHLRLNVYHFNEKDLLFRYRYVFLWIGMGAAALIALLLAILLIHKSRYSKRISYQAQHDLMTGVYNRATTREEMDRFTAEHKGMPCALLMIDVDDLKGINDNLGHAAGDEAITGMAKVLHKNFSKNGIIGRIGGDEFMVLIADIDNQEKLTPILEQVMKDAAAVPLAKGARYLNCSIGAALIVAYRDKAEYAYYHADKALYQAKKSGKNGFAYYNDTSNDDRK